MSKSDDTISRQEAIDAIKALYEWHDTVTEDRAVDHLKRLPSAEPKTGEWKKIDTWKYCSECGWTIYTEDDRAYNYCPNCGVRMNGCEE